MGQNLHCFYHTWPLKKSTCLLAHPRGCWLAEPRGPESRRSPTAIPEKGCLKALTAHVTHTHFMCQSMQ